MNFWCLTKELLTSSTDFNCGGQKQTQLLVETDFDLWLSHRTTERISKKTIVNGFKCFVDYLVMLSYCLGPLLLRLSHVFISIKRILPKHHLYRFRKRDCWESFSFNVEYLKIFLFCRAGFNNLCFVKAQQTIIYFFMPPL